MEGEGMEGRRWRVRGKEMRGGGWWRVRCEGVKSL